MDGLCNSSEPRRGAETHKVCDGPKASALVLLQQSQEEAAQGVRLPRGQGEGLVQDPIIHLRHVATVERRLGGGDYVSPSII